MKSRLSLLFAALLVFSLPLGAGAMSHSKHEGHGTPKTEKTEKKSKHQHHEEEAPTKKAAHAAHDHDKHAKMVDLGSVAEQGVKASAHLDNVAEAMAKAGMPHTHHLMVMFLDEKSGESIEEGTVAVKIRNPAGEESAPLRLVGMDGHFGADLTIDQKGTYVFTIGSSLIDGVKRQYEFKYENE